MNTRTTNKQVITYHLAGEPVRVIISASVRKSLSLRLTSLGDIDLRVPVRVTNTQLMTFLNTNEAWLLEQREKFLDRAAQRLLFTEHCYYLGKQYAVVAADVPRLRLGNEAIFYPKDWLAGQLEVELLCWYRREALRCYQTMIERWWPLFSAYGHRPVLRVKKMKTRWGSLSQRGYINMNMLLIQMPEPVIELVVVHELCHLKHFDHGAGFKAMLRSCLADVDEREKALLDWGKKINDLALLG